MTEHIAAYFDELHDQLKRLEKQYNPKGDNLHFEAISKADNKLFDNLLKMSGKAIEIVKDEPDHYSNKTPYAYKMFGFWYDYFLLINSASCRVIESANSDDFPQETRYRIIDDLIYIEEFADIVSGDLTKRHISALSHTLEAFSSDNLMNFLKNKKKTIKSKHAKGRLDAAIKSVQYILKSK